MATAKPQPLHNFPLSLKWGQTTTLAANHHQPRTTNSPVVPDSETESDAEPRPTPPPRVGSRSARLQRISFTSCSAMLPKPRKGSPERPQKAAENNGDEEDGGQGKQRRAEEEEEEDNLRPWKLRPRKPILKESASSVAAMQVNEQRESRDIVLCQKQTRLRGLSESVAEGAEKKERKLWIPLSKDEIEEDIFVMTGSRPVRRPKKRPKNVQKVLDTLFPGLWMSGMRPDYYRLVYLPVKK
ncbi:hypothetical protein K2173_011200 [Erythroxylum novogranatense]|uniref:Uncharacterized protein n=1 Tax=Erythroxylum novogranatense TaxID=1862640 RepID=A0AAV8U511_9ROSI|nr:hypothetical protein K2173_011200 [Erythroxylum novogranatense]